MRNSLAILAFTAPLALVAACGGDSASGDGDGDGDTIVDCGSAPDIDISELPECLSYRDRILECCDNPAAQPLTAVSVICTVMESERNGECQAARDFLEVPAACDNLANQPVCTGS